MSKPRERLAWSIAAPSRSLLKLVECPAQTRERARRAFGPVVTRILMLDGDDVVIACRADGTEKRRPGRVIPAFAHGREMPGRLGRIAWRHVVQYAVPANPVGIE